MFGWTCVILVLFTTAAFASETQYFTNEDLKKYNSSPVTTVSKSQSPSKAKPSKDPEHWCSRAKSAETAIKKAKDDVSKHESTIASLQKEAELDAKKQKSNALKIKSEQKKLEEAKSRLKKAEDDLKAIHDDARQKDIPAGWLRCQFTW